MAKGCFKAIKEYWRDVEVEGTSLDSRDLVGGNLKAEKQGCEFSQWRRKKGGVLWWGCIKCIMIVSVRRG